MIPLIIGAAMGATQAMQKTQEEKAQRDIAAATIANSPYTGANINQSQASIHPADPSGTVAAGALGGYQQMQQNKLSDAYIDFMKNTSSPGSALGPPGPTTPSPYGATTQPWQMTPQGLSGSAGANYASSGPYGGLQSVHQQAAQTQKSPYNMAPTDTNGAGSALSRFPYADAVPPGYRGPTRNRDGTLGPYIGGKSRAEDSYDDYDYLKGSK